MLDIIERAPRTLTTAGLEPDQAAAITQVVQQAVEQGGHVTSEQFQDGPRGVADRDGSFEKHG